jgi:hypothetical protein
MRVPVSSHFIYVQQLAPGHLSQARWRHGVGPSGCNGWRSTPIPRRSMRKEQCQRQRSSRPAQGDGFRATTCASRNQTARPLFLTRAACRSTAPTRTLGLPPARNNQGTRATTKREDEGGSGPGKV